MNKQAIDTNSLTIVSDPNNYPKDAFDYTEIIKYYGLEYKTVDYYLQVGEIKEIQGWRLDISVIISQLSNAFEILIPELIKKNVSFKIPSNKETARYLLNGNYGNTYIGKVICIYPESDQIANSLSASLIELTKTFKGPKITTGHHLGSAVYTSYGNFSPTAHNEIDEYIYNTDKLHIIDDLSTPFQLSSKIRWPFTSISMPVKIIPKAILNEIYKPNFIIKLDPRGHIMKGLYVKGFFRVGNCLIKQGKKNMISDDYGRDIGDRLIWQKEIHETLSETVPLPKILDLFQEDGNTYLIMEFIKGNSLTDQIKRINHSNAIWFYTPVDVKLKLLNYLQRILSIIEKIHQKGFIHRDITSVNFMIDRKDKIHPIDMELAYCDKQQKPTPPFDLGTPGFMSPEQLSVQKPTVKEDIYGLGALMIEFFTGLTPSKFNIYNFEILKSNLNFFIRDKNISNLISDCVSPIPEHRPELTHINNNIEQYKLKIQSYKNGHKTNFQEEKLNQEELDKIILNALNGLIIPPMLTNTLWISKLKKEKNFITSKQKEYTIYPGFYEGLSGILFFLGKAQKGRYDIDSFTKSYYNAWQFIEDNYNSPSPIMDPGLYHGSAGVTLAYAAGVYSKLLKDNRDAALSIQNYLKVQCQALDLATGITGQILAILQCYKYLEHDFTHKLLEKYTSILLTQQKVDGTWDVAPSVNLRDKVDISPGFSNGISGITWVLLLHTALFHDSQIEEAATKALRWLIKKAVHIKKIFTNSSYRDYFDADPQFSEEVTGPILCFIKAYEIFGEIRYKQEAETLLNRYSKFIISNNVSQQSGLADLGEVYLEAFRVLKNEEWLKRAEHIANVFIHTAIHTSPSSCYWMTEETPIPAADFITGNTGILHFLIRCKQPELINYRLLI